MTTNRLLAKIASIAICVLLTQFAFSQNKTITGKVTDDKGSPLQGATISVRGSKTGTSTDASGAFRLSVPPGSNTLVITSVGFSRQEVDISDKSDISVSLVNANASLNEVVVTGYMALHEEET